MKRTLQLALLSMGAFGITTAATVVRTRTDASDTRVTVRAAAAFDVSRPLYELQRAVAASQPVRSVTADAAGDVANRMSPVSRLSAAVEQTTMGHRPPVLLLESFDGHGVGLVGPHGTGRGNNPSDNSLAVGPNHIIETVNSLTAIYTKKGELFDTTGTVLFGPIGHNVIWSGFGGPCEASPNGDTVVRYDQLADRWLIVMPRFNRAAPPPGSTPGTLGPYGMCYAISTGPNPLGPYYRYYFERELFPDYPRPAIWPDGYYNPTSTGDNRLPDGSLPEKHACVLDRTKALRGLPATEQCVIIRYPNFLNNADIDGKGLPPAGAPNIIMAAGGAQLDSIFTDDGIYYWKFHVDWQNPANTKLVGPTKITVAPYHYLCNGQLTRCVPQAGSEMRLDAQGDKIMQRLVYRNIDGRESIVAVHSVNTAARGGGVRWYEFRLNDDGEPVLHQQGTYAPDGMYRWMASPAMDRQGNIGIGYSYGGPTTFPGQRFAARFADDSLGRLTFHETVLVDGQAASPVMRWQDYTTTAMDPTDDCTMWYQGDYVKEGAISYTVRIGSFRVPGCLRGTVNGTTFYDVNRNGMRDANEPGLPGRHVEYAGRRGAQDYAVAPAGTLITDARGDFRVSLPADSAYFDPTYTISARAPGQPAWTRTASGTAYASAGPIRMTDGTYTVRLTDRDDVTHVSFGYACAVANTGGALASYWLGNAGRNALSANDQQPAPGARAGGRGGPPGWRGIVNNVRFLVHPDGSRLAVSGTFDEAYEQFQAWLRGPIGSNASHALATQLAVTALNAAYGQQDANATVQDPLTGEWLSISALLARASTFVETHPNPSVAGSERSSADAYRTLLQKLNDNTATVTPSTPTRCPQ